jgi:transcriptional regulator with XRE-family HTH domain
VYQVSQSLPIMLGKNKSLTTTNQAFGIVLREMRKQAGFTQEGLAFEAGIERNYVSLIELGRNQPTITVVFKLAKALDIRPSKLIAKTEKIL